VQFALSCEFGYIGYTRTRTQIIGYLKFRIVFFRGEYQVEIFITRILNYPTRKNRVTRTPRPSYEGSRWHVIYFFFSFQLSFRSLLTLPPMVPWFSSWRSIRILHSYTYTPLVEYVKRMLADWTPLAPADQLHARSVNGNTHARDSFVHFFLSFSCINNYLHIIICVLGD
jgi:hypothetical protein